MNERLFFLAYKLPSLAIGAFIIIVSLFLVVFAQGCIQTVQTQTHKNTDVVYYSSNPTALGAGLDEGAHALGEDFAKAGSVAAGGLKHVGTIVRQGLTATGNAVQTVAIGAGRGLSTVGLGIVHGVQAVATGIGNGSMFVVNTVANSVVFVIRIPMNVYGFISGNRLASALISPSQAQEHNDVPIIDPNDPALLAAQKALPAIDPAQQPVTTESPVIAWPLHGAITTYFGEKGPHYHPTHTGIDISDGKHSPIKAYRAGTVIAAGRDGGLGNRVIVDHGNGVTSVYGHMSVIYAQVGQQVDTTSTLGLEGTTGVSTGNHLHFEIRINGQAADPLLFISGRP
jgi:murein DD-endopeptidase MepM/ murein hydrolase activator NlpD